MGYFGSKKSSRNDQLRVFTSPSEKQQQHPHDEDDSASTAALVTATVNAPLNLKIKRVDHYYSWWSKCWKYRTTGSRVTPDIARPVGFSASSDPNETWPGFCFVVIRKLPRNTDSVQSAEPTFQVVIKSPYLVYALKEVIQEVPGLSWTAQPLELDPLLLLAFLPHFIEYQGKLLGKRDRTTEESNVLATVEVLIDYLQKDYRGALASIANLTAHGEITFDLLYAILVPRTILITECPSTGAPRALQLVSVTRPTNTTCGFYDLVCESVDVHESGTGTPGGWAVTPDPAMEATAQAFGRVQNRVIIPQFKGTLKITELDVYPIKFHPAEADLRRALLARGTKWRDLSGVHHMQYVGTGVFTQTVNNAKKTIRYDVNSRVMIDRASFRKFNPNYDLPITRSEQLPAASWDPAPPSPMQPPPPLPNQNAMIPQLGVSKNKTKEQIKELTDDELLLASPIVYGFSLADKTWLEFNVERVVPVAWDDEAFANLVLPPGRKTLLQSLVEAHNAGSAFDDFVKGKGHGLVINMFGPPGVGKTLSAEATSEHVRRPLYVVGCGNLGTKASELDAELEKVFELATAWKAIILIDEADVFLEQRSLHDLERNAMVAVFLRHVEYYCGILFLTTNRVQAFDAAFLSRIHVGLHFQELAPAAKAQVWRAFLARVGARVDDALVARLAQRAVNGRQIKNATRTASSLAASRGEPLAFAHLAETLDAMDEFAAEFRAVRAAE